MSMLSGLDGVVEEDEEQRMSSYNNTDAAS